MRRLPTPRPEAYRLYWYFASERQAVFERRVVGLPAPWTDDPILREFKFCSVFRAADRVSQYMVREVCYHEEACTPEDRLFQIVAFRTFSNIETWRHVRVYLGRYPTVGDLDDGRFTAALDDALAANRGLYTAAFILCASNHYGHGRKHLNHVAMFRDMFVRSGMGDRLRRAGSLEEVYGLLHAFPMMGDFMSYQTAIDLNYSDLLSFSEDDFTQPGPGAVRGMAKCFVDLGDYTPQETILWMVERQAEEFARYGLAFGGLWGRPLHAIDCQGLFCETDKYCREALPGLASGRKRIKARFVTTSEPLALFFPPKWGINDRLPTVPVLGTDDAGLQAALF